MNGVRNSYFLCKGFAAFAPTSRCCTVGYKQKHILLIYTCKTMSFPRHHNATAMYKWNQAITDSMSTKLPSHHHRNVAAPCKWDQIVILSTCGLRFLPSPQRDNGAPTGPLKKKKKKELILSARLLSSPYLHNNAFAL